MWRIEIWLSRKMISIGKTPKPVCIKALITECSYNVCTLHVWVSYLPSQLSCTLTCMNTIHTWPSTIIKYLSVLVLSSILYRERFIPLTRRTTVSYLIQDKERLTDAERKEFEHFSLALDAVVSARYSATLQELKVCFCQYYARE